jgi:hypothetical protein
MFPLIKAMLNGEYLHEIWTQLQEVILLGDIQPSNYVGFRIGVTHFYEVKIINAALLTKMNVSSN